MLGPAERMAWASRALAAGVPYVGADFRFDPPHFAAWDVPAVLGRGDRDGQARREDRRRGPRRAAARARPRGRRRRDGPRRAAGARARRVAAVGGRPRRALAVGPARRIRPPRDRRALRRSDDRLPPRRRRARRAGVRLQRPRGRAARGRADGPTRSSSTRAAPRFRRSRSTGACSWPGPATSLDADFNLYRRLISDLVVSVGGGLDGAFPAELVLRPLEPLEGRVAVFAAGPCDIGGLDAEIVHVSRNLGNRAALAEDLARVDADTYLVEVKGAAIDVVAEHALARGRRVVLAPERRRRTRVRRGAPCPRAGRRPRRDRTPIRRSAAARRARRAAVLEGDHGARADRGRGLGRARVRARAAHRAGARRARRALARVPALPGARGPGARQRRRACRRRPAAALRVAPGARHADRAPARRRRPAPASRASRPRPRTASGSRASRRRTSSGRRCARSSRST